MKIIIFTLLIILVTFLIYFFSFRLNKKTKKRVRFADPVISSTVYI